MKLVVYNRAMDGVRPGEKRVLAPKDAARLEAAGDVVIVDHPAFPHRGARQFAGLPPPIPAIDDRSKRPKPAPSHKTHPTG
jgi:hypothetical protein